MKPENILWHRPSPEAPLHVSTADDDTLAIADFGCAADRAVIRLRYPCVQFCPPEATWKEGVPFKYDHRCDVWGLGATWLASLGWYYSGVSSYGSGSGCYGYRNLRRTHPEFWEKLTPVSRCLLEGSLAPDPADRATAGELADLLSA
jgi:serine/threonine protein kinase